MKPGSTIGYKLLLLLLVLVVSSSVMAQVQVTVMINRLSSGRYPTKLYQFQQYPNVVMVTLTNTTAQAQRVFINGVMTGDNGIRIRTKANYTPGAIDLAAFQQKRLNATEVAQLFDQSAVEVVQGGQDVKNNIIRDQELPEGMYQVCVRAFDYTTRQPVSPEEPLGCSNSFTIATLEAPVILSPMDRDSIKAYLPQNMILRWSIPPGAPPSTQYTIKIVEAFKNYNETSGSYFQANANEIIQTTPTPIFETTVTGAGAFLYGPGQPPLIKGRSYALVVTARDLQQQAQFRNNGQSQAILFKYGITAFDDQQDFVVVNQDTLRKQPTTVKGRLQYRFGEDTSGRLFPVARERVYLQKLYVKQDSGANGKQYTALNTAETNALPPYQDVIDGEMTQTDASGNFELHFGMTTLDSAGVIPGDKWNQVFADQSANPRIKSNRYSPLSGASLDGLKGKLACVYKVVINNPHYLPYKGYLEITPGGVRDVTDMVLDANSYSLKVNVKEVFNGTEGGFAAGAAVKIYRLTHYKQNKTLGIPLYEGDIIDSSRDWKLSGDKVLIASRTTPSPAKKSNNAADYTVTFSRLFRSSGAEPYQYLVQLEKGGSVLQSASFSNLQLITGTNTKQTTTNSIGTPVINSKAPVNNSIDNKLPGNTLLLPDTKLVQKTNLKQSVDEEVLHAHFTKTVTVPVITSPGKQQQGQPKSTDKWQNWSYNQSGAIAFLTLQKELLAPPRSRLTGTLQYKFKNDNATPVQPYANMPVKLMVIYMFSRQEGNTAGNQPATGVAGSSMQHLNMTATQTFSSALYQNIANTYASADPVANSSSNGMQMQTLKLDKYERVKGTQWGDDNGQVLQTVYTDAQGKFSFDFENADSTMQVQEGKFYTGTGDLTQTHTGKLMRVYRVVPDVPYYCAPDNNIAVQPWGDYDCGTLTSFVRTYNLNVHVVDSKLNNFEGVPIHVYRSEKNPYLAKLPERPGEDINQRVSLFGTPATGGGNSNNAGGNTTLVYQPVLYQTPVYNVTATNTVNASGSYATAGSTLANVTGQSHAVLGNSYILKRSGFTANNGVVTFKNLVLSMDKQKDTWLVQADGETGNRTGAITFETAYLDYPKNSLTEAYSAEWYRNFYAQNPGSKYGPIGGPHGEIDKNAYADNTVFTLLFNSEFNPDVTADAYLLASKKPPRVAGRVIDQFTTLGIPGVTVKVEQEILLDNKVCYNTAYATNGRCPQGFYASTDANGYFDVKSFSDYYKNFSDADILNPNNGKSGINTKLLIEAPGYESYSLSLASGMTWGKQVYNDPIVLKPVGVNCFGYVADAQDSSIAVAARIKLKINGRWVDTYSYTGAKYKATEKSNYLLTQGIYGQMLNNAVAAGYQLKGATNNNVSPGSPVTIGMMQVTTTGNQVKNIQNTAATGAWSSYINTSAAQQTPATTPVAQAVSSNTVQASVTGAVLFKSPLQRFDIDLPAKPDSIIIMPYDPAYLTVTKAVKVTASGQYLGVFGLQRRKHKVQVTVLMRNGITDTKVRGAAVVIDGINETRYTNQMNGDPASFEFINNATSNFVVRVKPGLPVSGPVIFVPESVNFSSTDDGSITNVTVRVSPGDKINGRVLFAADGKPVKGARVYLDQGNGTNSEVQTVTNSDGSYTLVGVPKASQLIAGMNATVSYVIKASYSVPGKTFVGDTRKVTAGGNTVTTGKPGSNPPVTPTPTKPGKAQEPEQVYTGIDMKITEAGGIDMSRICGIPVRIEKMSRGADTSTYIIDGEFYNLPSNDNFAMRQDIPSAKVLPFHNLRVKAATLRNNSGVPIATPVEETISLDCRNFSIKAFTVFNAAVTADATGVGLLTLTKAGNDTTALLRGKVRIVDNSFNFPTSYMTITGKDFFLGNYAQGAGSGKLDIPVFRSGGNAYPLTKFSITDQQAGGINFKYLGFTGITETTGSRESFVMGDSVNLFMNLTATIQGNQQLQFKSGHAVLRHDRLSRMVTNDSLRFNLEKWTVTSSEWELSPNSGGIVLKKGTLTTSKADLPFSNMAIIPGELICNSLNGASISAAAASGKLTIGGGATQLKIYSGTEVAFVYDPDAGTQAGKGHYKLSLRSNTGKVAYFGGLDGMTNAAQRFNIQFMSLLSNNEDLFAFDPETPPVTFYNQVQYSAQRMFAYEDRLVLDGGVSLGIAGVPDNIPGTFTFYRVNGEAGRSNRLSITPLQFSFTGAGGTKFTSSYGTPNSQRFTRYGIGIAGDVTLPDVGTTLKANLLSMVTEGARDIIQANGGAAAFAANAAIAEAKKQAEIYVGDALNRAAEFGDEAQDYVKGVVNDARNEMMNQLNEVRNTLQQELPVGTEQTIAEVAAKWRLAGEGINAIKGFDKDPVGALLRLNGVFKGFTGMDIKGAVEERAKMLANQALKGMQESLPVEQMSDAANSFKGMKFDFDLKNGRIMGSLSMPTLNFGAVVLKDISLEMLMDKVGWYFYAGAGLDLPQAAPLHPLIFPISTGVLIGNYPTISPALEARVTQTSYVKKLPKTFKQGVHGFFLTGKKEIISATSVSVQILDVDFEIGANAGLDARLYANFGKESQQIGLGAMAFGNAYAKMSVLFGACGVKGDVAAELGVKAAVTNNANGVTVDAKACASLEISGRVWCLLFDESYKKSIMALLSICGGADCKKAIDFSIKVDGGSCSASNDFDY